VHSNNRLRWAPNQGRNRIDAYVSPAASQRQACVLIVETQDAVRGLLRTALEQQGYRALLAANGEEALAHCREQPHDIDIVLLDTALPGIGFTQTLRSLHATNRRIRCCLMMTLPSALQVSELAESGALCVLRKPFHLAELALTLRALAGQWRELPRSEPSLPFQLYQATPPGVERREAERYFCRLPARCWPLGDATGLCRPATVQNLSAGGIGLATEQRLAPDKVAVVQIQNASRKFQRTFLVRVIHVRRASGADGWLHGCAFCERPSPDEWRSLLS